MQAPAFHLPEGESFQSLPVFWDHTDAEIDCKRDGLSEAEIESVYYESESGCEWGHTFRPCPHDDPNDSDEIENESESE